VRLSDELDEAVYVELAVGLKLWERLSEKLWVVERDRVEDGDAEYVSVGEKDTDGEKVAEALAEKEVVPLGDLLAERVPE